MNKKFKRFLSAILAVVMLFSVFYVFPVYALEEGKKYMYDDVEDPYGYNEICYDIYNGKARILSYSYPDFYDRDIEDWIVGDEVLSRYSTVVIPETINGYEVGYIGKGAFYQAEFFESPDDPLPLTSRIVLPDTLIEIGECSFVGCGLEELIIPDSVVKIGMDAFYCSSIGTVVFPKNIESLSNIFWRSSVGYVEIPSGVKDTRLFGYESSFGTVVFSEGIETYDCPFGNCDIDCIVLPKSLKKIGLEGIEMLINGHIGTIRYLGTRAEWDRIDTHNEIDYLLKECEGFKFICAPSPYIVESVEVLPENVELILGETKTLETTIKGNSEDTSMFAPAYKSSDESVATVDENGKVTALKKGTATITCTVSDDYKTVSDTCTVSVVNAVEKVEIKPDILEIYSGKSETLTTNITANTTDTSLYTVTYTSSDEDIAKVDENGKVTAYGRGTATITCTVTDDNGHTVSDTCEVTVKYTFWRWLLRVFLYIIGVNSRI